jgi:hypothetical protein
VNALSSVARAQLDLHSTQSATLPNGLTNHAPMLAIALARLGAPDDVVVQRASHEGRNAKPIASNLLKTAPQVLGESALDGLAGAGFHGLIRLAYGLDAQHAGEIASGLAYLRASALKLTPNAQAPEIDFSAWFEKICNAPHSGLEGDYLIADLLKKAVSTEAFQTYRIAPESVDVAVLASAALRLYLIRPNIDTLHGVTACHALRVVLEKFGDRPSARLAFAMALIALAIAVGEGASAASRAIPTLDELTAWLPRVWTRDAHTVKFTYTCVEEFKKYGDLLYLSAAYTRILK